MKSKIIILFIAIAVAFSCKRMIFPTTVTGIVIDKDTGEPISEANVVARTGSLSGSGYIEYAASTQTDVNGKFEFKFRANKPSSKKQKSIDYLICAYKEPDYPLCDPMFALDCYPLYCVDIKEGRKNDVVIEMEIYEYQN